MFKRNRKQNFFAFRFMTQAKNLPHKNFNRSEEKQVTKLDFGWVPFFTLMLTLLTAVLFGAGKAYRLNYLGEYGFTDTVIPWSFQDVVYLGITKQLSILLTAPLVALGGLFGFTILILLFFLMEKYLQTKRTKRVISYKKTVTNGNGDSLMDVVQFLANGLGAILFFGLLSLFFVANAEKLGRQDAKSEIASVQHPNTAKNKIPYVTIERWANGEKIFESGYLVSCSEHFCGLYSQGNEKNESKLVPLSGVISFAYRK